MASVYWADRNCFCSTGEYKQPNMRFFSLNENDEWTLFRSNSDYFYPEMIPEPDYSDSGDEAGSEDDEYLSENSRPVAERLRDVTEVYVSNADVKIKPASSKMSANKQASSSGKQKSKTSTREKFARQPGKSSPKSPRKARSTSPTRSVKSSSPTTKSLKSQESSKRTPVKTKSPLSKTSASVYAATKRTISPDSERRIQARPKSPPSKSPVSAAAKRTISPDSEKRIQARTKSPIQKSSPARRIRSPAGSKKVVAKKQPPTQAMVAENLKSSKLMPNEGTEEDVSRGIKATSKETTDLKPSIVTTKKGAGDAPKLKREMSTLSSPTTDESKSGMSSAASTEHSSEDELIKPKKPYQLSSEKQKLHKELKFSQRYGKLASTKTELQLALERFTENKEKKELEVSEKTSLEKILEIQARKLKLQETTDNSPSWMDPLQRPPAGQSDPKTGEFYRVHARVVSSNALTHCFLPDDEYLSSRTLTPTGSGSDS